ncbi:MAG TPA: hypothetical protein VKT70_03465 [Stellaceae bacterium]|nr:hypothetical protein [Stellaceae bacterium]
MIRFSTLLWLMLVAATGYGMFEVKYQVIALEEALQNTERAMAEDREAIRRLHADWSFLSKPARLDELARRHLDLMPVGPERVGHIETLPIPPVALPQAADLPHDGQRTP